MFAYCQREYWTQRYTTDDQPFEWYQPYSTLRPFIRPYIADDARVLVIGNGTSLLGEDLADELNDGTVQCLDWAPSAASAMSLRGSTVQYLTADCRAMTSIESGSIDVVIDKGCTDCLLVAPSARNAMSEALAEVVRVLAPGGFFISVSATDPAQRSEILCSLAPVQSSFAPVNTWPVSPSANVQAAENKARDTRLQHLVLSVKRPEGVPGTGSTYIFVFCKAENEK